MNKSADMRRERRRSGQITAKSASIKGAERKFAVAKPQGRKFLGFSFLVQPGKAPKAVDRFKERVREITRKTRGVSMERMIEELSRYSWGWRGYFGFCETRGELENVDSWVRRRARRAFWWQWKTSGKRRAAMLRLGANPDLPGVLHAPAAVPGAAAASLCVRPCQTLISARSALFRLLLVDSPTYRTALYANPTYGGVGGGRVTVFPIPSRIGGSTQFAFNLHRYFFPNRATDPISGCKSPKYNA